MKYWIRPICACVVFGAATLLSAAGGNPAGKYMEAALWHGTANPGMRVPQIGEVDTPEGKGIRATAVESGEWQGMRVDFLEPVDLSKIGRITFDFEQNAYDTAGQMAFMFRSTSGGGFLANPEFNPTGWRHVTIPVDARTLQGLGQNSAALGPVDQITITLYQNFKTAGTHLTVANLVFHEKIEGDQPLPVASYIYNAPQTRGDDDRSWLTDGEISKEKQVFFREYSDEPDITFDLGAVCRIRKFTLSAVAVPSQNAAAVELSTSYDGKKWRLAKHIPNQDGGTEETSYAITADNIAIYGRYVKVHVLRNRTDFPVRIAEIAFEGRQPTQEELADAAAEQYDLGPEMPEISAQNYWQLNGPGGESLLICKANGIAVAYEKDGRRLAERIFMRYELSDGRNPVITNSYRDIVGDIRQDAQGGFEVVTRNPELPGVEFVHSYSWVDGDLNIGLAFTSERTDKKILFTATEIVLPKDLRRNGLYETWGSGHDMQHKFSDEISLELPADTGPVMVFEVPSQPLTLLHCRYKYNDRYVQIGSGVVTVSGFGEKRTLFTPTGWVLGDGLFALTEPGVRGKVESRLMCSEGDLTVVFDRYLEYPEVKAFRAAIHRPDWLKDVRFFHNGPGWDSPWGDNLLRSSEYASAMIREGVFQCCADLVIFPWGNFSIDEYAHLMRGGKMKVAEAQQIIRDLHEKTRCKFAMYTWLWSVLKTSRIYQEHPDWFITYNADGKESSFFPGWATNFYRLISIPEHRAEVVQSILEVEESYLCDTWYLDGGGSPSSIDWPTMRIDEPDDWDNTLLEIRTRLQQKNPEHAVFFNHPENPIGDFGFLESFGGVLTTNWRDGATWMYKFKLWQRPDPFRSPLYIYWLPGVDQALRYYAVGTGLGLTFYTQNLRPEVSYMSAQQQSRLGHLVDARIRPYWRYEPDETLEAMALTRGNGAWIFLKSHDADSVDKTVSAEPARLGMTDPEKPLYHWAMRIKKHSEHRGLLTESEREADYRASRWQSDFVVVPRFLGAEPNRERMEKSFHLEPDTAMLWAVTQSPAIVYSVDGMRNQLWLPDTLDVRVEGEADTEAIHLTVKSDRKEAEIAAVLPAGKRALKVTVNGTASADADTIWLDGTVLAVVPVAQGESRIEIALADVRSVKGPVALAVTPGKPGEMLTLHVNAPADADLLAAITCNNDLVWSQAVKAGTAAIRIPTGVTGGDYQAVVTDGSGKILAEAAFQLAPGTPQYQAHQDAEIAIQDNETIQVDREFPARGFRLLGAAKTWSRDCGGMSFDPENAAVRLITADRPKSRWFVLSGAYEMEAKRYMKIRLDGNFGKHNREDDIIGIDGLGTNYDLPFCCFGLNFDFGTGDKSAGLYSSRTLGSLGLAWPNRNAPDPTGWGTGRVADIINILSNFGAEIRDSEEFWLDLNEVGAPSDWNGRLWFGPIYQCGSPSRELVVTVLECRDTLPAGAELRQVYPLKDERVKIERKMVDLANVRQAPVIDGKGDDAAWRTAPAFTSFSQLQNPSIAAPATEFRVLRDDRNLYFLINLTQPEGLGFEHDKNLEPWFCDSIEIWLGKRDSSEGEIQIILASNGRWFAQRRAGSEAGARSEELGKPLFAQVESGDHMTVEVAIPLDILGAGAEESGFNFCRTVRRSGQFTAYTLAPGRMFRNFDHYAFRWR